MVPFFLVPFFSQIKEAFSLDDTSGMPLRILALLLHDFFFLFFSGLGKTIHKGRADLMTGK